MIFQRVFSKKNTKQPHVEAHFPWFLSVWLDPQRQVDLPNLAATLGKELHSVQDRRVSDLEASFGIDIDLYSCTVYGSIFWILNGFEIYPPVLISIDAETSQFQVETSNLQAVAGPILIYWRLAP